MFNKMFREPSADSIAVRELEEAKRHLLQQQAAAEYAAKMVEYYSGLVNRLTEYVNASTK